MHADIKGAIAQFNKAWNTFEHRGEKMSKIDVKKVLEYANAKGYKTTAELTDEEVDNIITPPTKKD